MDRDLWERAQAVFDAAVKLPAEQREPVIDSLCGTDARLRTEVLSLLVANDAAPAFLEPANSLLGATDYAGGRDLEGRTLGAFKLSHRIGEGGMGDVYLATRALGELTQTVAVKVVHRGLDTAEILRRFERERRILAGLKHPGICPLLDGGSTADGRPYFVMPYLEDARPLDDWCTDRTTDLSERIDLFIQVCEAVHHAHQNLVIHADLKPANILVTSGQVQLVDFGIARLLAPESAEDRTTVFSGDRPRPHTPAYASPEQLRGEQPGTASDVFSLGVILYELTTGSRPARDDGALRPSQAAPPGRMRRALRGDLDNIILKALAAEPRQRYASASALADDLARWRDGLPVTARSPTLGYQLSKYFRRHPLVAGAMATAAVMLLIVVATVTRFNAEIREQAEETALERDRARNNAAFWATLFKETDPMSAGDEGEALSAVELLARAESRLSERTDLDPRDRAHLLAVISESYWGLGQQQEALTAARAAVANYGPTSPPAIEFIDAFRHLANVEISLQHLDAGLDSAQKALELLEARGARDPQRRSQVFNALALAVDEQGDTDRALEHLAAAIALQRELPAGTVDGELGTNLGNLAYMHFRLYRQGGPDAAGHLASAQSVLEEAIGQLSQVYGPDHPRVAILLNGAGKLATERGEHQRAITAYQRALRITEQRLPPTHEQVLYIYLSLGDAQLLGQEYQAAASSYRKVRDRASEAFSAEHVLRSQASLGLGRALQGLDQDAEAKTIWQELLAIIDTPSGRAVPDNAPLIKQTRALLGLSPPESS